MNNVIQFPGKPPKAKMPPIDDVEKLDRGVFKELCHVYDSADSMLESVMETLRLKHQVDLKQEKLQEINFFLRDTIVAAVLAVQDIYHPMQEIAKDFWEGSHLDV